ncbi:MAG: LacI family transcriptional regulator [Blautia sp.]|nr:LacI family transcriptional regulator [Lachnoclostridium sp.]MCM1212513.1 LacI family transcriptional regulator [Blautia sp.]
MSRKVTIKDVAREAGVSVATVSYVVNNRTDLRISDATRKKVLQVINLLNYTPNQAAKALATNSKHLLAILLSPDASVLKKAEQLHTIQFLSQFFHEKNYELLFLNEHYNEKCDQADAIICYDISSEYFHNLGDNNFIPLTALDCIINDPLFFQINTDYQKLKEEADAHFHGEPYQTLMLTTANQEKEALLKESFPDIRFLDNYGELSGISNQNLLLTDFTLHTLLQDKNWVYYAPSMSAAKAGALLQCVENALQRTPTEKHHIFI